MHPAKRLILRNEFWLVGELVIQRDADGRLSEYIHELSSATRLNAFAAGPFCRFGLPAAPHAAGVYAIVVNDEIKYVGECADLARRFGPSGYGLISPRNCHHDGQSTNCKLNSRVLAAAKTGAVKQAWFRASDDRHALEAAMIAELVPPWNGRDEAVTRSRRERRLPGHSSGPSALQNLDSRRRDEFRSALLELLSVAERANRHSVQVRAGDLHRDVGGYPGRHHRMPSCCAAIRAEMRPGDRVVRQPPKGNGANLIVEFQLPRER